MKLMKSSVNLASSIAIGLVATHGISAQAATWTFGNIAASKDCYVDSRFQDPATSFCSEGYVRTGFLNDSNMIDPAGTQVAYAGFDLSSVMTALNSVGASNIEYVKVVSAALTAIQTSEVSDNPNNPNGDPRTRLPFPPFNTFSRITDYRIRPTNSSWEESTLNYTNRPVLGDDILASGRILARRNNTTANTFIGDGLLSHLSDLFNDALATNNASPELSIGLESRGGLYRPLNTMFPLEDLLSRESGSPMQLSNLTLEVFSKLDNLDTYFRAGAERGDWESAIRRNDVPQDQGQITWTNGLNISFLLEYDDTTGNIQLFYDDLQNPNQQLVYTSTVAAGQSLDGLRLYGLVRPSSCSAGGDRVSVGTNINMQITGVRQKGSTNFTELSPSDAALLNVTTSTSSASDGEIIIPFSSFNLRSADAVEGTVRMGWPAGGVNPQTACAARDRVQIRIEPWTTIAQPTNNSLLTNNTDVLSDSPSFSTNDTSIQSVPEPTSVIGLLMFGLAGIGLKRHHQDQD